MEGNVAIGPGASIVRFRPKGPHQRPFPDILKTRVYWGTTANINIALTASDIDNTGYTWVRLNNIRDPEATIGVTQLSGLGYSILESIYDFYIVDRAYVKCTWYSLTSGIQSNLGTIWMVPITSANVVPAKVLYAEPIKYSFPHGIFKSWPKGHENNNLATISQVWYPSYSFPARHPHEENDNWGVFAKAAAGIARADPASSQFMLCGYSRVSIGTGGSAITMQCRIEIWYDITCVRLQQGITAGDEAKWIPSATWLAEENDLVTLDAAGTVATGTAADLPDRFD